MKGAFALTWRLTTIKCKAREVKKRSVAFIHNEYPIGPHRTHVARDSFSVKEAVKR
jgi:hypothetical protein